MTNELKGIIFVTLSGLCYGLLGYFGVNALESSLSIANMMFWRFFIAALFIGIFLIPQLSRIEYRFVPMASLFTSSAIFYASGSAAFFAASQYIGTGVAMVIFFTYPVIVILCNWFLYHQAISKNYIASVVLILLGLLLLIELKFQFNYVGVAFSIISAAGYAFYIVSCKRNCHVSPLLSAWLVAMGCSLACFIYATFNHSFFIPTDTHFWLHSAGLGIFSTAVPILLLLQGLKYVSSEKASILGVLEPIFVVLVGVMFLGETLVWLQVVGVVVVLGGALLSLITHRPHNKKLKSENSSN